MRKKKRDKTGLNLIKAGVFAAIALGLTFTSAWAQPEITFHGQFRVNYYTDSKSNTDKFTDENQSAHRLRFRPTWDVAFDDGVKLHMQFNIGHINTGVGNHNFNQDGAAGGTPSFGLRHGYLLAPLSDSITGIAGVVPVSDKFGDTLFSGDWDFNPVALAFLGKSGNVDWRLATGKIQENSETAKDEGILAGDDIDVLVLDVDSGGIGGSVYYFNIGEQNPLGESTLTILGVRWAGDLGPAKVNAFVIGSALDRKTADIESSGFAAKLEGLFAVGDDSNAGIMLIYTTGDKDAGTVGESTGNFVAPMSLIGHTGYWGYTGRLNVQGPTDTGIDNQMINIDNAGAGLMTIQAKYSTPLGDKLDGYFAVGFYQSVDTPDGVSDDIGTDIYAQGKYNLGSNLNLEFGVDYVILGEGHAQLYKGGLKESRNITTLFSRLQMEW